jgi:hypothetical protein
MQTITMKAHHATAYTACAVYEYLYTEAANDWPQWLDDMLNDIGAPAVRDFVITELADYINTAWFYAGALNYGGSLDYDFIPQVFRHSREWPHFHKNNARSVGVAIADAWKVSAAYASEIPF